VLAIIWAHGEARALLSRAIEQGEATLASRRTYIARKISEQSSRWIPRWIDQIIADKLMDGMLSTLAEMRDPSHPWRIELQNAVERLIDDLAGDPQMHASGEAFKANCSPTRYSLHRRKHCGLRSRARFIPAFRVTRMRSRGLVKPHSTASATGCRTMPTARRGSTSGSGSSLSDFLCSTATRSAPTLSAWSAIGTTTLVERLELQVGKDLQYIRINGTLVGGLVGLAIFIASKGSPRCRRV
jgi:hypothetical protein